jgi:hypothetical protein
MAYPARMLSPEALRAIVRLALCGPRCCGGVWEVEGPDPVLIKNSSKAVSAALTSLTWANAGAMLWTGGTPPAWSDDRGMISLACAKDAEALSPKESLYLVQTYRVHAKANGGWDKTDAYDLISRLQGHLILSHDLEYGDGAVPANLDFRIMDIGPRVLPPGVQV